MIKTPYLALFLVLLMNFKSFANDGLGAAVKCEQQLYNAVNTWDWNYGLTSYRHTTFEFDNAYEGLIDLMNGIRSANIEFSDCSKELETELQDFSGIYERMRTATESAAAVDQVVTQTETADLTIEHLMEQSDKRDEREKAILDADHSAMRISVFVLGVVTS